MKMDRKGCVVIQSRPRRREAAGRSMFSQSRRRSRRIASPSSGRIDQSFGRQAQDCARASLLVEDIGRCGTLGAQHWGLDGGIIAARGGAPGHFHSRIGGDDDRTMDLDSVCGAGRSTRALGRSYASMSDIGAVVLIFVVVAVALTTIKRLRR